MKSSKNFTGKLVKNSRSNMLGLIKEMILAGHSNYAIAVELGISFTHIRRVRASMKGKDDQV